MKKEVIKYVQILAEETSRYKLKAGEYEGHVQSYSMLKIKKVEWADRFYMITNPLHRRKPHLLLNFPPLIRSLSVFFVVVILFII